MNTDFSLKATKEEITALNSETPLVKVDVGDIPTEQPSALQGAVTAMHVANTENKMEEVVVQQSDLLSSDWEEVNSKPNNAINLTTLRIATQVRELVLQGITLKNTMNDMHEVWLSLYTPDQRCPIVEQTATKVRAQLITLYAVKLIKYINSIVGLDLVPLAADANPASLNYEERSPADINWKLDAIILNIGSNRIRNHGHMFTLMMVNVFGVSEQFMEFAMDPTWEGLRNIVKKTYDYDLGDTEFVKGFPELELVDGALLNYLACPSKGYHAY
ncbi:hypothetical protein D5W64_12295 [Salmonella enterica subsp. enterica serovar Saintpaul]|nr:hypothetical protein [Salmonella enterica subsp. enterica serovar Saintpaul]